MGLIHFYHTFVYTKTWIRHFPKRHSGATPTPRSGVVQERVDAVEGRVEGVAGGPPSDPQLSFLTEGNDGKQSDLLVVLVQ